MPLKTVESWGKKAGCSPHLWVTFRYIERFVTDLPPNLVANFREISSINQCYIQGDENHAAVALWSIHQA
jgi:hypothetical protein